MEQNEPLEIWWRRPWQTVLQFCLVLCQWFILPTFVYRKPFLLQQTSSSMELSTSIRSWFIHCNHQKSPKFCKIFIIFCCFAVKKFLQLCMYVCLCICMSRCIFVKLSALSTCFSDLTYQRWKFISQIALNLNLREFIGDSEQSLLTIYTSWLYSQYYLVCYTCIHDTS